MYIGFHVKYPLFLPEFSKTRTFWKKLYKKSRSTKFHENPSSWSLFVPCGQTDGQSERHEELIVGFRNSAKAPKIGVVNIILAAIDAVKLLPEIWLQ
jgi:hypothetical protein